MSPDDVRKAADSFDPLKAIRWTVWQALAWIVHPHADRVRECSEIWREKGPRFPVKGAALGPFRPIWEEVSAPPGLQRIDLDNEVIKSWHELQRALESGRVDSSGKDAATGIKRKILELEWDDLRFANPRIIDGDGEYQYVHAEPQLYWEKDVSKLRTHPGPAFLEVRVRVADVLKEFPLPSAPPNNGDERGPGVPDRTGAPGRPSSMHLVLVEAERRRSHGETLLKVTDEASALFEWFQKTHPGVQSPTQKTIKNKISSDHRTWKNSAQN